MSTLTPPATAPLRRERKPIKVNVTPQPESADPDGVKKPLSPIIRFTEATPMNPIELAAQAKRGPSPHSLAEMLGPHKSPLQGKISWPELVGVDGEDAVRRIKMDNPDVEPVIIRAYGAEPEIGPQRCVIHVDEDYRVTRVPTVEFAEKPKSP